METFTENGLMLYLLPPHSLGKLIEWKLKKVVNEQQQMEIVPTRWGN